MYQIQDSAALLRARRRFAAARREGRPLVPRTVVLVGLTSLFTDISSEMVAAVLPLYLVAIRGLDPLQFGVIDGIYQGGSAIVRIVFGFVADRLRRYRDVAALGYGLSAVSKLGLAVVGTAWASIGALVLIDRTGKGIRTAPRDALISLSTSRADLGVAFGVHRALDTCGAMLGPIVAFGLLALAPDDFRGLFLVSFCFALIGLAILVLLVRDPPRGEQAGEQAPGPEQPPAAVLVAEQPAAVLVAEQPADDSPGEPEEEPTLRGARRLLTTPRFGGLVVVTSILSLMTISDAFVYLELDRRIDFDASIFPLLYAGTALVFMLLAVPVGRLADRVGRERVFMGGYGLLLALYILLQVAPATPLLLLVSLVSLGCFYAATDGVLAALGSALAPETLRGTGLAMLGTATGIARFAASIAFGAIWTFAGIESALLWFTIGLAVALAAAAVVIRRTTMAVAA